MPAFMDAASLLVDSMESKEGVLAQTGLQKKWAYHLQQPPYHYH